MGRKFVNFVFQELSEPWGFVYFRSLRRSPPAFQKECFNWKEIATENPAPPSDCYILSVPSSLIAPESWRGWPLVSDYLYPSDTGPLCQSNSHYSRKLDNYMSLFTHYGREVSLHDWPRLTAPLIYGFKHRYLEGNLTDISYTFWKNNSSCFRHWRMWHLRPQAFALAYSITYEFFPGCIHNSHALFHYLIIFAWDVGSIVYRDHSWAQLLVTTLPSSLPGTSLTDSREGACSAIALFLHAL